MAASDLLLGGSVLTNLLALDEQRRNRNAQNRIADQNFQLGLRDQDIQRALGLLTRSDLHSGQVDARGNRSFFEPGVGFKTELSDRSKQLQDAGDTEQLRRNTFDAQRTRTDNNRSSSEASRAGRAATSRLLRQTHARPVSAETLAAADRNAAVGRNNETVTNTTEGFLRNQNRAGSTGNARALLELQRIAGGNLPTRGSGMSSSIASADSLNNNREQSGTNVVSNLLNQSRNVGTVPFNPQEFRGPNTSSQIGTMPQGLAISAGLMGAQSPQRQAPAPVGTPSLALGSITDALTGYMNQNQAQNDFQNNINFLTWFMGNRNNPLDAAGSDLYD